MGSCCAAAPRRAQPQRRARRAPPLESAPAGPAPALPAPRPACAGRVGGRPRRAARLARGRARPAHLAAHRPAARRHRAARGVRGARAAAVARRGAHWLEPRRSRGRRPPLARVRPWRGASLPRAHGAAGGAAARPRPPARGAPLRHRRWGGLPRRSRARAAHDEARLAVRRPFGGARLPASPRVSPQRRCRCVACAGAAQLWRRRRAGPAFPDGRSFARGGVGHAATFDRGGLDRVVPRFRARDAARVAVASAALPLGARGAGAEPRLRPVRRVAIRLLGGARLDCDGGGGREQQRARRGAPGCDGGRVDAHRAAWAAALGGRLL
mmetsp:Transcript_46365/g.154722  ORF Transcript_46365/g.154722 Transcript_46365/m.154722 type:complete len:326 (-) Transcript_46365:234-1211(-)